MKNLTKLLSAGAFLFVLLSFGCRNMKIRTGNKIRNGDYSLQCVRDYNCSVNYEQQQRIKILVVDF